MSLKTGNQFLVVLACLFVVSGIITLLPARASLVNDLGYSSLCPFAPRSSIILLLGAGICVAIRNYMLSRTD
jgi:hypothetical protein